MLLQRTKERALVPRDPIQAPERLAAVREADLLNTPPEEAFDQLTCLAARLLGAPIALLAVVDKDRQFFKSCIGDLPEPWRTERETPLSHSFCQHAVTAKEPLVIEDAREHPLVQHNPAIRDLGAIAYAGALSTWRSISGTSDRLCRRQGEADMKTALNPVCGKP
jgi:hypothetical protein